MHEKFFLAESSFGQYAGCHERLQIAGCRLVPGDLSVEEICDPALRLLDDRAHQERRFVIPLHDLEGQRQPGVIATGIQGMSASASVR